MYTEKASVCATQELDNVAVSFIFVASWHKYCKIPAKRIWALSPSTLKMGGGGGGGVGRRLPE